MEFLTGLAVGGIIMFLIYSLQEKYGHIVLMLVFFLILLARQPIAAMLNRLKLDYNAENDTDTDTDDDDDDDDESDYSSCSNTSRSSNSTTSTKIKKRR